MKLWYLFRIEFIKGFWQLKRYPFDAVTGIITLGGFFFLLLGAGQVIAGATPSKEGVTSLIITYVLGFFIVGQVQTPTQVVSREAKSGMLEQLFLSGHALPTIFMMRSLGGLVSTFIWIGAMMAALFLLTGTGITWSFALFIPLIPMLTASLGVGLIFGAIAMLFKETNSIFGILQIPLFLLAGFSAPTTWWQYLIPVASSSGLTRALALGQTMPLESLLLAFLSAAIWLMLGILVFQLSLRIAQQRGILGHE
jgi:ABC-2 type transport system permease protein